MARFPRHRALKYQTPLATHVATAVAVAANTPLLIFMRDVIILTQVLHHLQWLRPSPCFGVALWRTSCINIKRGVFRYGLTLVVDVWVEILNWASPSVCTDFMALTCLLCSQVETAPSLGVMGKLKYNNLGVGFQDRSIFDFTQCLKMCGTGVLQTP